MKKRFWHRYKVQAYLTNEVTSGRYFPYQSKNFFLYRSAKKHRDDLHRGFGPNMIQSKITKV